MANSFLKFADAEEHPLGILGTSKDAMHPGWIEILSFSWGVNQNSSVGSTGKELHATTEDDAAAMGIGRAAAVGTFYPTVVVESSKNGAVGVKAVLYDVVVSAFHISKIQDRPVYQFSLNATGVDAKQPVHDPAPAGPPVTLKAPPPPPTRGRAGMSTGGKASSLPRHGR